MNLLFDCIKIKNEKEFFITSLKVKEIKKLFIFNLDPNYNLYDSSYNIPEMPKIIEINFSGAFEFLENNNSFGKLIINSDVIFHLNEHKKVISKILSLNNFEEIEIGVLLTPVKIDQKSSNYNKNIVLELLNNYHELFQIVEKNGKLSPGSAKLFTIKTIEDSEDELINMTFLSSLSYSIKYKYLEDFWTLIIKKFKLDLEAKELKNYKIREDYILISNTVIRALSRVAAYIIKKDPNNWKNIFNELVPSDYNFWKKDNILWENNNIINSKENSLDLISKEDSVYKIQEIILKVDKNEDLLYLYNAEYMAKKIEEYYLHIDKNLLFNKRIDGNISIKSKKVFAYLDFLKNKTKLVARLHINPSNSNLSNYTNIYKLYSGSHQIGNWGKNIIEVNISDEKIIPNYIELFEIAKNSF